LPKIVHTKPYSQVNLGESATINRFYCWITEYALSFFSARRLAAGFLVVFLTGFIVLRIYSSRAIARMRNGHDPYAV